MRRERPCPVDGCKTWIGDELLCIRHWNRLPDSIRATIRRAREKTRSRDAAAYQVACATAIRWLNDRVRARRQERRERIQRRKAVRS
jgi:hypothetical protein